MQDEWKLSEEQLEVIKSYTENIPVGGARFNCACGYIFSSDYEIEVFRDRKHHWDFDCPVTTGKDAA